MNLNIRPMHDSETPLVRDTWTRSIDANEHTDGRGRRVTINGRMRSVGANHCPWMRLGGEDQLVTWAFYAMHRAWVKSMWGTLDVIVAAHPVNDEAVGWCAFTPPGEYPLVVHYVYTVDLDSARRKGHASRLLRAALSTQDHRPTRFSHMNPAGKSLLDAAVARVTTIGDEVAMH